MSRAAPDGNTTRQPSSSATAASATMDRKGSSSTVQAKGHRNAVEGSSGRVAAAEQRVAAVSNQEPVTEGTTSDAGEDRIPTSITSSTDSSARASHTKIDNSSSSFEAAIPLNIAPAQCSLANSSDSLDGDAPTLAESTSAVNSPDCDIVTPPDRVINPANGDTSASFPALSRARESRSSADTEHRRTSDTASDASVTASTMAASTPQPTPTAKVSSPRQEKAPAPRPAAVLINGARPDAPSAALSSAPVVAIAVAATAAPETAGSTSPQAAPVISSLPSAAAGQSAVSLSAAAAIATQQRTVVAPTPMTGHSAPSQASTAVLVAPKGGTPVVTAVAPIAAGCKATSAAAGSAPSSQSVGRWTREEHEAFLEGLKIFGREWKKVATHIPTRTSAQIRSHAQKYFARLAREERQHQAAAAAAAVAAQQPVGLAASSLSAASSSAATGGPPGAAANAAPENLPPSVMQNVERILADPVGVQREVERTLGALRERYRQLQRRMEEQQRQRQARQQRQLPLPPQRRDPRAGGKLLAAPAPVAVAQQERRKRTADEVVVEAAPMPAASAPVPMPVPAAGSVAAPAPAPSANSTGVARGGDNASCLEIRSAELIALQVLGGTLPRSGSGDPLGQSSSRNESNRGDAGRPAPLAGRAVAADAAGSGDVTGNSSPSSIASIGSSSEMKEDSGSDDRGDGKRQRTME